MVYANQLSPCYHGGHEDLGTVLESLDPSRLMDETEFFCLFFRSQLMLYDRLLEVWNLSPISYGQMTNR